MAASSILTVAQTGLNAAQIGMTTTGHNIANANTKGYSRQVVIQGTAPAQNRGEGFIGKGTTVAGVTRIYDDYLGVRVNNTQSVSSGLESYYTQIRQINNLFSDSSTGIAPNMQEFFNGIQALTSDPNSAAARQSMMSGADQLIASFRSVDNQLSEIQDGVNSQIASSVANINSFAQQIASLNTAIENALGGRGETQIPNDLLDQRNQVIADMAKEIKVTTVEQGYSTNVFVGTGQPVVVGQTAFSLAPTSSSTDNRRAEVAYVSNNSATALPEAALTGGFLGGLLQFRSNTLDMAQNALGRIATSIAMTFNEQHQLGQDLDGNMGGKFFDVFGPLVSPSGINRNETNVTATVSTVANLTNSDYMLGFTGTDYTVTRSPDNKVMYSGATPPSGEIDGITFTVDEAGSAPMAAGDRYLVRPAARGASSLALLITDNAKIAAAAPIRGVAGSFERSDPLDPASPLTGRVTNLNSGSGKITDGAVTRTLAPNEVLLKTPVSIVFLDAASFSIDGGAAQTYTAGDDISYNGWTVKISGTPDANDTFSIGPNTNGVGDSRNALLLAGLQTSKTMDQGKASFQSVFGQTVSAIGSKTHELEVTSAAERTLLRQSVAAMQDQSGVSLDEEATNLLRYQQAYAASAKVMQTAQKMFDILISLGAL